VRVFFPMHLKSLVSSEGVSAFIVDLNIRTVQFVPLPKGRRARKLIAIFVLDVHASSPVGGVASRGVDGEDCSCQNLIGI